MTKSEQIKKTLAETREKRVGQACKVFELKVDKSHLNSHQKKQLTCLFLEAKWLYNYILSENTGEDKNGNSVFGFDTKTDLVQVKLKDGTFEDRKLTTISSQIKQSVKQRIIDAIKSLSAKKKKSKKKIRTGRLKFKSEIRCIDLKQFGNTYKVVGRNRIRVQGIKHPVKVTGMEQIRPDFEIANAKLVRRHGDYFFKVTCFVGKDKLKKKTPAANTAVGIDFGVKTDLVLSNGERINVKVSVGKDVKRSHKNLSRKEKGSCNRERARVKLEKQYAKINNRKKEKRIKTAKYLLDNFETIAVQDESIRAWHSGLFGRQVQESAIGGIMSELKKSPQTLVVGKFIPTTKRCRGCGTLNDIGLNERTYSCVCGYSLDRDIHSALNILEEGLKMKFKINNNSLPAERRDGRPAMPVEKPAELRTSAVEACLIADFGRKFTAVKQEATHL